MQVSKSLIHSGIHRTGGYSREAGLPVTITPNHAIALSFPRVPHSATNHDVVAASQGVH